MTKEQLLDFCKSQNWSTKIEIYEENFCRLRIDRFLIISDIGIHNTRAYISFEIDESTKEVTIKFNLLPRKNLLARFNEDNHFNLDGFSISLFIFS